MKALRWILFLPSGAFASILVGWLISFVSTNMAGRGQLLELLAWPVSAFAFVACTCVFVCVGAWTAPRHNWIVGVSLTLLVLSILAVSMGLNGLMWFSGDWVHDDGPMVVFSRMALTGLGAVIGCALSFSKVWMLAVARVFFSALYILGFAGNAILFMATEARFLEGGFIHAVNPLLHLQVLFSVLSEPVFWVLLVATAVGFLASNLFSSQEQ